MHTHLEFIVLELARERQREAALQRLAALGRPAGPGPFRRRLATVLAAAARRLDPRVGEDGWAPAREPRPSVSAS